MEGKTDAVLEQISQFEIIVEGIGFELRPVKEVEIPG